MGKKDYEKMYNLDLYLNDETGLEAEGFSSTDIEYLRSHKAELQNRVIELQDNAYSEQVFSAADDILHEYGKKVAEQRLALNSKHLKLVQTPWGHKEG